MTVVGVVLVWLAIAAVAFLALSALARLAAQRRRCGAGDRRRGRTDRHELHDMSPSDPPPSAPEQHSRILVAGADPAQRAAVLHDLSEALPAGTQLGEAGAVVGGAGTGTLQQRRDARGRPRRGLCGIADAHARQPPPEPPRGRARPRRERAAGEPTLGGERSGAAAVLAAPHRRTRPDARRSRGSADAPRPIRGARRSPACSAVLRRPVRGEHVARNPPSRLGDSVMSRRAVSVAACRPAHLPPAAEDPRSPTRSTSWARGSATVALSLAHLRPHPQRAGGGGAVRRARCLPALLVPALVARVEALRRPRQPQRAVLRARRSPPCARRRCCGTSGCRRSLVLVAIDGTAALTASALLRADGGARGGEEARRRATASR